MPNSSEKVKWKKKKVLVDASTMTDVTITKAFLKPPVFVEKQSNPSKLPAVPQISSDSDLAQLTTDQIKVRMSMLATDEEKLDLFNRYAKAKQSFELIKKKPMDKLKSKVRLVAKLSSLGGVAKKAAGGLSESPARLLPPLKLSSTPNTMTRKTLLLNKNNENVEMGPKRHISTSSLPLV